jgi:hypothetical protein
MERKKRLRAWRTFNKVATFVWLLLIPAAAYMGWLESVVFVSAISIYANVAAHLAAWRADS